MWPPWECPSDSRLGHSLLCCSTQYHKLDLNAQKDLGISVEAVKASLHLGPGTDDTPNQETLPN